MTITGFSIHGFSVAGFSDGGQADAPERSGIGFQDAVSRSLICRWFRHAVLPEQPKLERAILNPKQLHRCEVCGRSFLTHSGRAKYCRGCAAKVHRKQKSESARKRRSGVDK